MHLSLLIVTHNSRRHIGDCVKSLERALDGIESEVVVVDNASTDGTTAQVRDWFPSVRVIALEENLGFAAGINTGLAATTGRYVWWVNPDSQFVAGRVSEVLAWMDAHPEAGIVGGKILDPDGAV